MDFDFNKPYPPEFYFIEDVVREARQQMDHMNQGMNDFPDKGVNSHYFRPKEGPYTGRKSALNNLKEGEWPLNKRFELISALVSAQEAYHRAISDYVEKVVKQHEAEPEIASWVTQSARKGLGDIYKDTKSVWKPIGFGISPIGVSNDKTEEPEKPTKPEKVFPSLSARYSQTLNFTKVTEVKTMPMNKHPNKEVDKGPDKD